MIVFNIIIYYLIIWFIMYIAIQLDNVKDTPSTAEGKVNDERLWNYITYDLRQGNWWALVIPGINIIAAIIYLIRGLSIFLITKFPRQRTGDIINSIFISKKKYDDK